MRCFNTEGPVVAGEHYLVDPLSRVDVAGIDSLVERNKYFVLHAPRQTGKTSTLLSLVDRYNATGAYRCVYVNVESAQAHDEDIDAVLQTVLRVLGQAARLAGDDFVERAWRDVCRGDSKGGALYSVLTQWAESSPLPLILMIDEIDTLRGKALLAVLREIRSGYTQKPRAFPSSIVLCGVRDVRDYRLQTNSVAKATGSSFNIKASSLRLGDFTRDEVVCLLGQHTTETGQLFEPAAIELVWDKTRGQPWLVNAVAYEACFRLAEGRDRTRPVTPAIVERAAENLIVRRETHLDQLAAVLEEERVRHVGEPLVAGGFHGTMPTDDVQYCIDLGLLVRTNEGVVVANPIYREVIPRQLTEVWQQDMSAFVPTAKFVCPDRRLDTTMLLSEFQQFLRMHADWVERAAYREASHQLLVQAFLQRVVNGGGLVEREYGIGRGRTDLLVRWPLADGFGAGQPVQLVVIELKVLRERQSLESVTAEGLQQTAAYMDGCGAEEGHLVVFDCRGGRSWDVRLYRRDETVDNRTLTVWGM